MWARCFMPGNQYICINKQYFFISWRRWNPGIHSLKEVEKKILSSFDTLFGSCDLNQKSLPSVTHFAQVQGALTVSVGAWLSKYPRDERVTAALWSGIYHLWFRGGEAEADGEAVCSGLANSGQVKEEGSGYFRWLVFPSNWIPLFPIICWSL